MDFEAAIREAYKQQKHSKCVELINSAPDELTSSSQYKILKASCLNNITGQSKAAHLVLDEVINNEAGNAFAYYGKGLVFINEAKLNEAVKCFDQAIELEPSEKMEKARQMKARVLNMLKPMKKKETAVPALKKSATPVPSAVKQSVTPVPSPIKKSVLIKTIQLSKKVTSTCPICEKTFDKKRNLSRHMLIHSNKRPFSCGICERGFLQKSDLNRHVACHSDVTNFPCTLCEKGFKTQKSLKYHLATHSERPFKCEQCGKAFNQARTLDYHCRTHKYLPLKKKLDNNQTKKTPVKNPSAEVIIKREDIKDEIGEFELEMKIEETDHSDDGILSSQSLTFGDLESNHEDDSDWNFCLSLLNDMAKMDDQQKIDFRLKTQQAIKEIMN